MIASKLSRCRAASASSAVQAVVQLNAGGARMRDRSLEAAGSSSTAKTRVVEGGSVVASATVILAPRLRAWLISRIATSKPYVLLQHPRPGLLCEDTSIVAEFRPLRIRVNDPGSADIFFV